MLEQLRTVEEGPRLPEDDPLAAALAAVRSHWRPCKTGDAEQLCLADPSFDEFLTGLREQGFQGQEASMRLALQDPTRWWGTTIRRAMDRAMVVELQQELPAGATASSAKRGVRLGLAAGPLLARRGVNLAVARGSERAGLLADTVNSRVEWAPNDPPTRNSVRPL